MKKLIFYVLLISFITVSITGIAISFRMYRLFNFKDVHEIASYIFLVSSIIHIYFNRRGIVYYLKNK
ncbi:DUF4405 domain-containing protein [Pectinatus brassicae]|uniref:Cytochrome b subunit of formate dehydrogenase n=1 Tax=Pectinatus brassicae TaxID=862415 RepID=A0A840UZ62_9FIRM|nr:DUF4405 domain-containing protein [Pectinatus brassicae]MBB5337655.1 cytochrome b subunit of formate dehydrogenase [Pectinatus brassicae]